MVATRSIFPVNRRSPRHPSLHAGEPDERESVPPRVTKTRGSGSFAVIASVQQPCCTRGRCRLATPHSANVEGVLDPKRAEFLAQLGDLPPHHGVPGRVAGRGTVTASALQGPHTPMPYTSPTTYVRAIVDYHPTCDVIDRDPGRAPSGRRGNLASIAKNLIATWRLRTHSGKQGLDRKSPNVLSSTRASLDVHVHDGALWAAGPQTSGSG
jgi:hypothetical protein